MKEFERDSKLPFWVIFGGEVIACFATWYAVHSVWGMCGHAGFDWCGHEASMMFKAARGSIVLSAMLSGGLGDIDTIGEGEGRKCAWLSHRLCETGTCAIRSHADKRGGRLCDGGVCAAELRTHDGVWRMAVLSTCTCCVDGRTDSGGAVFYGVGTEENVGRKDMAWAGYGLRYVGYAGTDGTMPLDA